MGTDNYRSPNPERQVSSNRSPKNPDCPDLAEKLQRQRLKRRLSEGDLTFQVNLLRGGERCVAHNTIHQALRRGRVGLELLAQIVYALRENVNAGIYLSFDGRNYQKINWFSSGEGTPTEFEVVEIKSKRKDFGDIPES